MRCVFILMMSVMCISVNAQIHITPFMPDEIVNAYPDAAKVLESKLNNILSSNGIKTQMGDSRFILTGNWIPETKDVVGSAPTQIAYTLNINLYIGDGEDGTKYISETFRVKGVGTTEEKAHLAAIRNLQSSNQRISVFVQKGKERIISYYEQNKENIMASINSLITKEDYDEAVYQLCLIPMECSYYADVQSQINDVFQRIIDNKSEPIFTEAKTLWAANQNANGASQVIDLVSQIDPNASCYPAVQKFIEMINAKINLINERAYATYQKKLAHRQEMDKLELEAKREQNRLDAAVAQTKIKANASVEKTRLETNASVEKTRLETNAKNYAQQQETQRERDRQSTAIASQTISASERLQSQRISAARDVAVTYAKNRPKTVVYNVNSWY